MEKITDSFNKINSKADDNVAVEAFLRAAREILDGNLESYTLDQVDGARQMLEQYLFIKEEIAGANSLHKKSIDEPVDNTNEPKEKQE